MKQKIGSIVFFILLALAACNDRDATLTVVINRSDPLRTRIATARSLSEKNKDAARQILGEQLMEQWDSDTLDTLSILDLIGDESTLVLLRSQKIREQMLKDEGKINAAIDETIVEIENRLAKKKTEHTRKL